MSKEYIAKTVKGSFPVVAENVKDAWVKAKKEADEINDARREIGLIHFNYHLCRVVKILRK